MKKAKMPKVMRIKIRKRMQKKEKKKRKRNPVKRASMYIKFLWLSSIWNQRSI
ncbi:unnamed protein product [Leptidea sinapis]|uniref:Uncharacterized protein n=1 Tax=Leptidea sinapis TaxID=189913 RepID=A0A5E4QW48_9NEOP|nr:unnamed protein product [Leptidea sinapis]